MASRTVVVATAAAVTAVTAVALYLRSSRKRADVPEGYEKITLNENEESWAIILNPDVCTQTF